MIALAVGFGMLSVAGLIERYAKPAMGYESMRWGMAAAIAMLTYLSRIEALDDLNNIFRIDGYALPLTAIAGTAMRLASKFSMIFAVVFWVSVILIALMKWGSVFDDTDDDVAKIGKGLRVVAALLASGLAWAFIHTQLDDKGIKAKLYRIAHKTDFVGAFDCAGVDTSQNDALFIGPDQRRILVAPKINELEAVFFV